MTSLQQRARPERRERCRTHMRALVGGAVRVIAQTPRHVDSTARTQRSASSPGRRRSTYRATDAAFNIELKAPPLNSPSDGRSAQHRAQGAAAQFFKRRTQRSPSSPRRRRSTYRATDAALDAAHKAPLLNPAPLRHHSSNEEQRPGARIRIALNLSATVPVSSWAAAHFLVAPARRVTGL